MTETAQELRILLIDDDPDRHDGIHRTLTGIADVSVAHPVDVTAALLEAADLVSVDEYFQDDRWISFARDSAESLPAALQIRDGLAVAAAIRSQARAVSRPLAITLHTGAIRDLAGGLPAQNRESLVAAQHDLEWVFEFGAAHFGRRLADVAAAARSLTRDAHVVADDFGASWLALPDRSWTSTARVQLEDCRPPAHSLARDSDGLSYLRWFTHRVLPYPTFLLSADHAANLLGIDRRSFELLEELLRPARYVGPMASFLGKRWWRAGLQQYLVDCDVFQWDSAPERASALADAFDRPLVALTHDEPVVSYDKDGRVVSIDANPEEAVRLQQDGWPVWADDPWASIEDVNQDDELRQLVAQVDRQNRLSHHER